ncbi:MAG: flippase-like domain-containing protein [Planctomycetes bacterium]|nr:flippase-like domain-containing protein [Planctomycetota bacterium]
MVKLLLGGGILWFIAGQMSIDDEVRTADEVVRGREVTFERGQVWLKTDDGDRGPWDIADSPVLRRKGDRYRVDEEEGTGFVFKGFVSVVVDGHTQRISLDRVALTEEGTEDGWVEQTLDVREGLATIYARITVAQYLLAMACILGMYLCGIKRWQVLLRAQGIDVTFFESTRFTFIGFFFNNVVPGMTGGDVVKAVMIARAHKGRGPDAVSTVIVDRVVGLVVLAAIAAVVLVFTLDTYGTIALWVFLSLGCATALICLFLSRRVRKWLRIDRLLKRLPGSDALQRLDQAFLLYRSKGKEMAFCVAISLLSHMFNIASVLVLGLGLGVDAAHGLSEPVLLTYVVVIPIIMIVAAVPALPGGWGIGEAAFGYFFRTVGIHNLSLSVGLSVLHRFSMLLWSLLGGVFLFLSRREAREAMREAQTMDSPGP